MTTAFSNQAHFKSNSPPPPSTEDEINAIDQQLLFINKAFKWNNSDLERVITMLRTRFAAEDAYVLALVKAKKAAQSSNENNEATAPQDTQASSVQTFQHAIKLYDNALNDIIDGRQKLRDALKLEIDKLVQIKESEDAKRKKIKTRLSEVNLNYSTFRTRDIIKLQKNYIHKCEELKLSESNWQKLQLQHAQQQEIQEFGDHNNHLLGSNDEYSFTASPQETTDGLFSFEHKKGMAEIISQMKTRAVGSTRLAPLDQNKQNTKVMKMKKDITETDGEYRQGVLTLEHLRKKQSSTVDEIIKNMVDIYSYDVSTFATVLKTYFRELKRPLFELDPQTKATYMSNISRTQRLSLLENKLSELSFASRSTLHQLIFHLSKPLNIDRVNESSHVNKMHIQNLGVIFKPAIFHDFKQLDESTMVVCPDELFEDLIVNQAALFHNAESHAQKIHESRLKQALPGQKLYSQSSQSNLLYAVRKQTQGGATQTPQSRNMLLTQPMNPPKVQDSSNNNNSGYYNGATGTSNTYYSSQQQQHHYQQQQYQQQQQQQQQQIPQQQYQQQVSQTQTQSQQQVSKYPMQQQQHNQYYSASESTNNAHYSQTQRKASLAHSQQSHVPSTPVYSNSAGMGSNSRLVPQGHRIDSIEKAQVVPNNTGAPQSYSIDTSNASQYNGSQNNSPMTRNIQDTSTIQSQKSRSSTSLASGNLNTRAYYSNNTNANNQGNYPVENVSPVPSTPSSYYRPSNYKKATHLEISTIPNSPLPPRREDSLGHDTPRSNSSLSSPIVNNETDFATYYSSPSHTDMYAHPN
ncbi:hypothetical protein K501DRAFT_329336 [Backusella circina FSU 941]|nr:hypothetical protein K501DRAFT_329336 [Backusella circina FSU 941]